MNELNSSHSIEVNGVKFETLVPNSIVTIPQVGQKTSFNLGVRITNNTSTPYRFDLQLFSPELLTRKEQLILSGINRNTSTLIQDSDIPLISPEEKFELMLELYLIWFKPNFLICRGEMYGGILEFSYPYENGIFKISQNQYWIRLKYINLYSEKQMFLFSTGRTQVKQFWQGQVLTPFTKIFIQEKILK